MARMENVARAKDEFVYAAERLMSDKACWTNLDHDRRVFLRLAQAEGAAGVRPDRVEIN